jgi:hypothetical protein
VIHQLAFCRQRVVMVCCLFFNFAELFDFGWCSLAQEMSFVSTSALFQAVAYHLLAVGPPAFPAFVY